MKILCVGHSVLDLIFNVLKLPDEDGKYMATGFTSVGGGPAANAAVTVASLGAESYFAGRVGNDTYGENIVEELNAYNVNCDFVRVVNNATTSLSSVVVDAHGDRQIVNYKDARLDSAIDLLKQISWAQFDAILVDVRWSKGAEYALRAAKKHNIPTILDADVSDDDITALVENADYVIFSQPGLKRFIKIDDPKQALEQVHRLYSGAMSVTLGSQGVYYYDQNDLKHQSGIKVNAIDTTAAGDVFHGAFAYHIAVNSKDINRAMAFAAHTAALKCTKIGGRKGIPNLNDVEQFIKEQSA